MICRGARAQVFETYINGILINTPFLFSLRPLVISIFHAKHISGGSQAIKVKVTPPPPTNTLHGLSETTGAVETNNSPGGVLFNYLHI